MGKRYTDYNVLLESELDDREVDTMRNKKRRNSKKKHIKDNKRQGFIDNSDINWEGD